MQAEVAQSDEDDSQQASGIEPSWAVSLCFWFALLIAVGTYSLVALAPKFCVWNRVRLEHHQNRSQLVSLEGEVAYLERVEAALKTDPEFRDRIAGVAKSDPDETLIPVSGSLLFGYEESITAETTAPPTMPSYHSLAVLLASHRTLRASLLLFSSCLVIFAFAFLNDAGGSLVSATGQLLMSTAMIPIARYFEAEADPEPETTDDLNP